MAKQLTMGKSEWSMLVLLSLLWGSSFFFAKIALVDIPPLTLVFLRVLTASAALALILQMQSTKLPRGCNLWLMFICMGILNNLIPFSLFYWGQTQIGAGLASIFNAMAPLFTILVAHALTSDEHLSTNKIIGTIFGTVGVVWMIGIDIRTGTSFWIVLAMLGCLGAALSYGFASVYGRRFSAMGISPISVAFGQVTGSALLYLPVILMFDSPWELPLPSGQSIAAIAALGLLSTALGYVLFFHILARGGATNISLVAFLIPISAILLSSIFLGETLASNHVIGMVIIFAGLCAVDGRLWRYLKNGRGILTSSKSSFEGGN